MKRLAPVPRAFTLHTSNFKLQRSASHAGEMNWTRRRELAHRAEFGSRSSRARAQANAFLAGARNRARPKRQERIKHAFELPGTWLSAIRPAPGIFLKDDYEHEGESRAKSPDIRIQPKSHVGGQAGLNEEVYFVSSGGKRCPVHFSYIAMKGEKQIVLVLRPVLFLAGARNRARQKRQEHIHKVIELPGTWFSVIRPALPSF